jgi:hypothetical protein
MSEMACYKDDFSTSFGDQGEMFSFLSEREQNAGWSVIPTKSARFLAIDTNSVEGQALLQGYEMIGKEGLIHDTMQNTQLLLKAEDKVYPVRKCAISTILSRARISGNALSKLERAIFAQILNHCVKVAGGNALLRLSDDKISAMHGGDKNEYAVLEMPALFERITGRLDADFAGYRFIGGHFDHSIVTAVWSFPDNMELLDAYMEALAKHGIDMDKYIPAVRFTSSDVGASGANLFPLLMSSKGRCINLGSPLKLNHERDADMEKFEKQLALLYPRCIDAIKQMGKLAEIEVEYSYNTMMRVMQQIGVTKKLAYQVAELWISQHGEGPSTAHDLYLAISEASFLLQCSGADGARIVKMEENIVRALKIQWEAYDYPGEFKW